ncbi:hypothetical protein Patl1_24902 [Pistacia atlantica]|uniref:Uncharacterized protein n=1 Tax=Pistacia atlantica TaxID=434234 RepID=A0ACC1B3D7_9ROSI|nr:hypothetical protein Patl1_24902 [Pistacia atlantica]
MHLLVLLPNLFYAALKDRITLPWLYVIMSATSATLKQKIEETGKRLACFAKTLSLPFSFKVATLEADHNSPSFEECFFEVLFYCSSSFDSLEACMSRNDPNRMMFEEMYLGSCIQDTIANEGEERILRHMKIDAWRDILNKFGLAEAELSMSSLDQAELVRNKFSCKMGDSCTLDRNGKCLLVGWKG